MWILYQLNCADDTMVISIHRNLFRWFGNFCLKRLNISLGKIFDDSCQLTCHKIASAWLGKTWWLTRNFQNSMDIWKFAEKLKNLSISMPSGSTKFTTNDNSQVQGPIRSYFYFKSDLGLSDCHYVEITELIVCILRHVLWLTKVLAHLSSLIQTIASHFTIRFLWERWSIFDVEQIGSGALGFPTNYERKRNDNRLYWWICEETVPTNWGVGWDRRLQLYSTCRHDESCDRWTGELNTPFSFEMFLNSRHYFITLIESQIFQKTVSKYL